MPLHRPRRPRRPRWTALLAIACFAGPPCLAAEPVEPVEPGWILARLERPVPSRTPFVELRGSALLSTPLRVTGEYRRPAADVLVRKVTAPRPETTTLRGDAIVVERNGRTRRFALSRAPELAGLQAGFGALLAGDVATVEDHYVLHADGTRADWTLRMLPKDAALKQRLASVVLFGTGSEVRCIETRPLAGDVQRTLLAAAAVQASGVDDADALAALCRGD